MIGAGQLACLIALVTLGNGPALELPRSTIDSGGQVAAGGGYELRATIGQPEPSWAGSATFAVRGGFWAGLAPAQTCLFADGFELHSAPEPDC